MAGATGANCAPLARNCDACYAQEGCRLCEVGPQEWQPGIDNAAAQGEYLDYVCTVVYCEDLPLFRPGTRYTRTVAFDKCSELSVPTTTVPTTTTTIAQTTPVPDSQAASAESDLFFADWGAAHWLAIILPATVVLVALVLLWRKKRPCQSCAKGKSRVRVVPWAGDQGGRLMWDFSSMGPLGEVEVETIDEALRAAEEEAFMKGQNGGKTAARCVAFSQGNQLRRMHLRKLAELLDEHPTVSLRLPADWREADNASLVSLAGVLKSRGRSTLQANDGSGRMSLPLGASMDAVSAVAQSLATGAHAEVDLLGFGASARTGNHITLDLNLLRSSYHQLSLTHFQLGNLGCSAACAFVSPWAGRLQVVKLLECHVTDEGAQAVARLLSTSPLAGVAGVAGGGILPGGSGAKSLRELCLSANKVGDRGAAALSEALGVCDSLEKLVLDRNHIGPEGAKALASKLPRSSVRELVLGSHLGGNPLGPAGAEALAAALDDRMSRAAANRETRLTALALEQCDIQEKGAKALAAALLQSELCALSLARDSLGDAGAKAILDALPASLLSLDLAGNSLSDESGMLVGAALHRSPHLAVSVAQNSIPPTLRDVLSQEHGARLRV